jgi:hypothetical protein
MCLPAARSATTCKRTWLSLAWASSHPRQRRPRSRSGREGAAVVAPSSARAAPASRWVSGSRPRSCSSGSTPAFKPRWLRIANLLCRLTRALSLFPGLRGTRERQGSNASGGRKRRRRLPCRAKLVSTRGRRDIRAITRGGPDKHGRRTPLAALRFTPDPAVRAMPGRPLLLCSLFRRSWLTVEGGRQSAPPGCCIAGADGQPWPCRSAWLVAFRWGSLAVAPEIPARLLRLARSTTLRPQR